MNGVRWARTQWDRVLAAVLFVLGALALVLGWVGASTQSLTALQVPFLLSGGVGGIFLLGLGAVSWLSADLRDEWRALDRIADELVALRPNEPGTTAAGDLWSAAPPVVQASTEPARRPARDASKTRA